jgi:UDP-N-acetyl-2-amino-2-deoxyglucuronate dehydrogenase
MSYRVALIGTGRVGYQFSFSQLPDNHAEAVLRHPECELVAGVNRGRDKLEAFGQRFGVAALFHDYREMLSQVAPDICIIATHPELHAEMVEGCAAADSVRAIICEKPMALSLDECDRMIDVCRRQDILLQINHNRRWNPEWNLARRLLHEGAIGELNHIYGYMDGVKPAPWWRSDNEGPLLHDATHYLDLMDYFAGGVEWICGVAEQRRRPWAIEDFGAAFLKFKSGATGLLHAAELSTYTEHGFELRGSEGVMRLQKEKLSLYTASPSMREADSGFEWSALEERKVEHPAEASSYVLALQELLDALEDKGGLRSDGEVGRRSLEMVMAVYRSQLEGNRPVGLPLDMGESGVALLRGAGHFVEKEEDKEGE